MPNRENKRIAKALIDAFNDRRLDRDDAFFADNAEWMDMPSQGRFAGKDGFRKWQENWLTAFPDSKVEIIDVIATDDRIVNMYVGRGTQTGPLMTPQGTIPASGRKVELQLCDVMELKDGKIVRGCSYYDAMTMLRQIKPEPLRSVA